MTVNELMQKLNIERNTHIGFFEQYLEDLIDESQRFEFKENAYCKLYGAIWGLNTASYISNDERDSLTTELLNMKYPQV